MLIWLGAVIVILSFVLIVKKFEARAVLLVAGLAMCVFSGREALAGAFNAFISQLLSKGMVPTICFAAAFSTVMNHTGCTDHLIHAIAKPMKRMGIFALAFATLATCGVNAAVPSASSTAVAVGALFIPILLSLGYSPVTSASVILLGTWGGNMNPGASLSVQVAEIVGVELTEVWFKMLNYGIVLIIISMALAILSDFVAKKIARGGAGAGAGASPETLLNADDFTVNPLKAICPLIPIILILVSVTGLLPNLPIPVWMTVGAVVGMIVDRGNPTETIKKFFSGAGNSFGNVITLLGCAGLFTYGIEKIGLTGALIDVMTSSTSVARGSAVMIPMIMGALCGSGNAATVAFNGSILPHAAELGFSPIAMGSAAALAGAFGRLMSPVSGVAIICAGFAKTETMEITRRNAIPALLLALTLMVLIG